MWKTSLVDAGMEKGGQPLCVWKTQSHHGGCSTVVGDGHPPGRRRTSDVLIARLKEAIHSGAAASYMPRFVALNVGSCKTMHMVFSRCTPMRHTA